MSKKGIYIFLTALAAIIVVVIAGDFAGNKPGKRPPNPFEYNMTDLKKVDPEQILYRETRNFRLKMEQPAGMTIFEDRIYVVGDNLLQVIGTDGSLIREITLPFNPLTVEVTNDKIFLSAFETIHVYDPEGTKLAEWTGFDEKVYLSALAFWEGSLFIADAARRRVYRYNEEGIRELEFEGKVTDDALHGFIVPSACFDLAINEFGDFWVANPGKHALENYTLNGALRGYWSSQFSDVKGFTGCCNPAFFTFLPGGNFITSEKGVLRIKEYKPSGEFVGVVAGPAKFIDEGNVSDVAADSQGRIYACDPDKKSIRVFEKI
jgi:hypothetical protein